MLVPWRVIIIHQARNVLKKKIHHRNSPPKIHIELENDGFKKKESPLPEPHFRKHHVSQENSRLLSVLLAV